MIRLIHRNPRAMIFFAKMFLAALIGVCIYIKYFEDKILFETAAKATVIELSVPEINPSVRHNVATNKAILHIQLKDGTQARTFAGAFPPSVGAQVDVTVQTFESGKKKIFVTDQL